MFMSSLGKEEEIPTGEVAALLWMDVTGVTMLFLDAITERTDSSGWMSVKDSTSKPTAAANCSADIVAVCSRAAMSIGEELPLLLM